MGLNEPRQLRQLKIGPIAVDPPVVLAPMAGVTNIAFRGLCRAYGGGLFVSEMVMARALVAYNDKTGRMIEFAPDDPVRSVQLYGVDPAVMHTAVRHLVDDVGVDHVDLNFGCPAPKVTRKGGGAALPAHPVLFGNIVRAAVRAAGMVPVTVKMRRGIDDRNLTALEAARRAEDEGVAAVTLHARTAEQLYSGQASWPAIAELKEAITSIPVLGNGDIWTADDAERMMAETGCDGVVVGRGCLGRPWLFRELDAALTGEPIPPPPTFTEVLDVMRRHMVLLCDAAGEARGARDFRKHVSWYLTGYPIGRETRRALVAISSVADLDRQLDALREESGRQGTPVPLPRGPVNGPRRVALPDGWLDHPEDPNPPSGTEEFVSGG
jgi:nifR3 family TIM-barrel protein